MNQKKDIYAVVLAGGMGTRFWPLSRQSRPKQFIPIWGDKSLFQETLNRIQPLVPPTNIFVVTNVEHMRLVKKQTARHKIPVSQILLEPVGRNTAAAICWAAACIRKKNPSGTMIVLPSDHLILNQKKFQKVVKEAVRLASEQFLVTMGIVPTRPETGYGYLKVSQRKKGHKAILKVHRFVEKPSLVKAKKFLKSKQYLWNSGMFVWKAAVVLDEFKRHLPRVYRVLYDARDKKIKKKYKSLPSISIDYGILEKAKNILAVAADGICWSDLGSWQALWDILPKDKRGHVHKGNIISLGGKNSFIFTDQRLVAAVGLEDIVIVDTPDALLVCRKDYSQQVRDIVSVLKKRRYKKEGTLY